MRKHPFPYGAAEIVALRSAGKRPADTVSVSLIGPLRDRGPVVIAQPDRSYDWRFLVGLDVLLVANAGTSAVREILRAIDQEAPASLQLWLADVQDGAVVQIAGWRPATRTGRRMNLSQRISLAGLGSPLGREICMQRIAAEAKARAMENADRFDAALMSLATAGYRSLFGRAWSEVIS